MYIRILLFLVIGSKRLVVVKKNPVVLKQSQKHVLHSKHSNKQLNAKVKGVKLPLVDYVDYNFQIALNFNAQSEFQLDNNRNSLFHC